MISSKKKSRGGLFITFEGGEGSGKTTVLSKVYSTLKKKGNGVMKTREPGGTALGEKVRELLLNHQEIPLTTRTELFLFLAARSEHVDEVIVKALSEGLIVLCDRFTDSTLAYQGDEIDIKRCALLATGGLVPDLTLLFDLEPKLGLERAAKARKRDRIESRSLAFHEKVRSRFLELVKSEPTRFCVLDASLPVDEVVAHALRAIEEKWSRTTCLS